jgi:hypothetical protein
MGAEFHWKTAENGKPVGFWILGFWELLGKTA